MIVIKRKQFKLFNLISELESSNIITLHKIYTKQSENLFAFSQHESIFLLDLSKVLDIKTIFIARIKLIGLYSSHGNVIFVSFAVNGVPLQAHIVIVMLLKFNIRVDIKLNIT
ncbi:hypothetical protein ABPG72_019594 [Tetrahymena utriculariae]